MLGPKDAYDLRSTTDDPKHVAEQRKEAIEEKGANQTDYLTHRPKDSKRIAKLVREREEYRARAEALSAELQNRQPRQPQYQPPAQPQYQPQQYSPQQQQSLVEELNQIRAKLPEVEKAFAEKNPDYYEPTARLQPERETPIPPTSYYHLLLNTPNPEACAYHLASALESSDNGIQVIKELNDLSAGLRFAGNTAQTGAGSSARREIRVNQPPPPITPVRGSGYVSSGEYHHNMSQAEYNRLRDSGWGGGKGRR